jgi:2-dehydropantoate 2-reductase
MRYIILGAGAIGGAIGGRLHECGRDVVLVARGAHYEAIRERGLELRDPERTVTLDVPVADSPAAARPRPDDVVILATKTQQSEAALLNLWMQQVGRGGPNPYQFSPSVVCAQNGVENERLALRRFANVYGMRVILAGTHLEPGVVEISTAPLWGILDIGRYPLGTDETAEAIAADLRTAGFDAQASADVMTHKYLKLLGNLGNAIEAACGTRTDDPIARELASRARAEGRACYDATGITIADETKEADRRRGRGLTQPVGGVTRLGGSSWQSLRRGTGNIEADWLNGEIVLLGRLHGIPTPVNERLQHVANEMARTGAQPGSMPAAVLAEGLLDPLPETSS